MNDKILKKLGYVFDKDMDAYELKPGIWMHYNDSELKWGIHDGNYNGEELEVYFYGNIRTVTEFTMLLDMIS